MDGLECSEISLSYLFKASDIFRFDSYFYAKEFLHDESKISNIPSKAIKDLCLSLRSFGAYSLNNDVEYIEDGIPFIRGINMKNGLIDFSDLIYISEESNKLLWKSEISPETILLSMSGTIGDVAIAQNNWKYPINSNQDIAKISFKAINPYFIYTFFLTKYGQNYFRREARGSVQQHVFLSQIENLKIPLFTNDFQQKIENTIKRFHGYNDTALKAYFDAEQMLLCELGLDKFTPYEEQVSVKLLSNSFNVSGRLDAEYYQPKYDALFKALTVLRHKKLGELVKIKKSIEPGSEAYQEEGVPFIRVSDITTFDIAEPEIHLERSHYDIASLKPKKDTILLTKDGSVGIAYKVQEDLDVITSGALLHLKIIDNTVLPDYLTLVLNSLVVKLQSERDAGGSIIQHWKPTEIEQVIIPILPIDNQREIAERVQESFKLRLESKALLEKAKQAVELAIEQGEEKAIEFLTK